MEYTEQFKGKLLDSLIRSCTQQGWLDGTLPASPDIDAQWQRFAPSYYGDSVREFNAYPEYALACAGYLGMAVACFWDKDWPRYMDEPYSRYQGARGFDDMDDHITGTILEDPDFAVRAMQSCSAAAYHALRKESAEPGSVTAYKLFLVTVEAMYRIGAALQLYRLGYRFEAVNVRNPGA